MKKYAITINTNAIVKYKLKAIDSVYQFLDKLYIKSFVIAAERDLHSNNIHYHVLAESDDIANEVLWGYKIWNSEVNNENAYYEYIIKDGHYKVFNDYKPLIKPINDEYANLLDDIHLYDLSHEELRIKYPKLYLRFYRTICDIMIDKRHGWS